CDGLDTLAAINLNEAQVGKTDNQFRTWEFDVKPHLQVGENTLEICFESTLPYIADAQRRRSLAPGDTDPCRLDGSNRIRKSQCNYGWDWGPECVTAGIWRKIELLAVQHARIADLHIEQDHSRSGLVDLHVTVNVENADAALLTAHVSVFYQDEPVCHADAKVVGNNAKMALSVQNPELWWPNGLGEQPLYDVRIDVQEGGTRLDAASKKIGLRTLELDRHPDQWGESFQFVVNGRPFFAKGANWIPADTFVTRVSGEQYEYLIKSAADAHMNMLRVWGGGIYEEDVFYDLCDRYGICIWQDFMFACSAYPAFDSAYMDNVKQEAIDNVKRLRHHPSIALWCGNNELEQIAARFIGDERHKMSWAEYRKLFDELLPDVVYAHDPERTYWPSSPHSPVGERTDYNNPACGDAHLWDVWHGRKPFEWYRSCEHRFNSEFGFQSFPEP
ncbi:MAG: hypothetical protein GY794_21065, partial [bacterium]|nr:hypothetical protein [bacterium]